VSKKESEDGFSLFQGLRNGGGAPMGILEEPTTGAWEGSTVLEIGGTGRYREEEPDELSMMAKQSNRETGGVEEARGAGSGWRGGEEIVEGDPGGETEGRGQRGFHGEPLHGCPL
jgi:hypothetical protein